MCGGGGGGGGGGVEKGGLLPDIAQKQKTGGGGGLGEWRKEVFFQILPKSRSVFFISALMRSSHPKQSPKCIFSSPEP